MLTWHLVLGRERDFALFFTISNMYIAPGYGHTSTWYKFWQHFKAFIISIILYQFRKIPLPHYFIWYFVLFHTCTYSPRARAENPWGTIFLMEVENSYHFDHWLHVSKKIGINVFAKFYEIPSLPFRYWKTKMLQMDKRIDRRTMWKQYTVPHKHNLQGYNQTAHFNWYSSIYFYTCTKDLFKCIL